MSPTLLKLLLTLLLFAVTLIFGLAPFAFSALSRRGGEGGGGGGGGGGGEGGCAGGASLLRRHRIAAVLTVLNCVGGGIFLGVAFLQLLPEVLEDVGEALERMDLSEDMTKFPWASFAIVCGFFLVLALEQIVFFCQERRRDAKSISF